MPTRLVPVRIFPGSTVAGTASVTSGAVNCTNGTPRTLDIQVTSETGTPDAKIEFATSQDGTTFSAYTDYDAIVASTFGVFGTEAETFHTLEVSLPAARFLSFKITGVGSNPADTIATLTLNVEE